MKRIVLLALLALCLAITTGCSYNTQVGAVQNVNVYSAYEEKIPGNFALIIDSDPAMFNPIVNPSSYVCGAHDFPMSFHDAFVSSIKEANESIFESIATRKVIPTVAEMEKDNLAGYVLISGKMFEPKLMFIPGFWSGKSSSTVTIGFDYAVRDKENHLIITGSISGERSADGEAGANCDKGTIALSNATQKAMREVLERYGERVSNSQKLRNTFK